MAELPDNLRHLDEREGLVVLGELPIVDCQRALKRSLSTMVQAVQLFDAVAELLGDRAWLDPEGGADRRRLLLRDPEHPEWLVPTALLEHCWSGVRGEHQVGPTILNPNAVLPVDAPDDWQPGDPWYRPDDPEPQLLPDSPNMRAGDLQLAEGPALWRVKYDDRGVSFEYLVTPGDPFTAARYDTVRPYAVDSLARPPQLPPISLLCRADLDPAGHDLSTLATMVTGMDPASAERARVRLPLPVPGGAEGVWTRAKWGMREALWEGRVPLEARWLVADGFDGSAVAWGPTRDEALAAWDDEVRRVGPRPPGWRPEHRSPPEPTPHQPPRVFDAEEDGVAGFSTGTMTLVAPRVGELAWPMPLPRYTPAAIVPLSAPPPLPARFASAGFTRWVRLVGDHGQAGFVLVRDERDGGWTFVGDGALDLVDLEALEQELEAADAEHDDSLAHLARAGFPAMGSNPEFPCSIRWYRCWDGDRRERIPLRPAGAAWTAAFPARDACLPWRFQVCRVRWLG